MKKQIVKLLDARRNVVAVAAVADEGKYYGGTIDLDETPPEMRALFDEFDEIVNGQMFSFVDEIQDKIAALDIKASFECGSEVRVADLQVYPSTGDVSFKLVEHAAPALNSEAARLEEHPHRPHLAEGP